MPRPLRKTFGDLWVAVVIAAISVAVLMWYFLTSLGAAREPARRSNCQSNLRQIGLSIQMYAELYGGRCPVDGPTPTLLGSMRLLTNVFSSGKILSCPSDFRSGAIPQSDLAKLTTNSIGYSYVPNLIWSATRTNTILAVDRINATKAGSKWPKNGNHKAEGGNVLFLDGRVEWHTALPFDLRDKDGKLIVLSP